MDLLTDITQFQNFYSHIALFIMPNVVNVESFIRSCCEVVKIWDPIFKKKCIPGGEFVYMRVPKDVDIV